MIFRQFLTIALAAQTLLMVTPRGAQADAAATRKLIQAAYDKANAAMARKDLKGVFAVDALDLVATDSSHRKMDVMGLKKETAIVFQAAQSIKAASAIQKFTLKADQATVTVKEHTELTLLAPKGGKPSKGVVDNVNEDTWVKRGGVWFRINIKLLSQKITKDGKPLKS